MCPAWNIIFLSVTLFFRWYFIVRPFEDRSEGTLEIAAMIVEILTFSIAAAIAGLTAM